MFTNFDKALTPLVVTVVVGVLAAFGITEDMTVTDAVTMVVTSALVWLVPNRA